MLVKMLTMSAGPNGCTPSGSIVEVSDKQAAQLVAGRFAEYATPPMRKTPQIETASIAADETATLPRGARKIPARPMR